MRKFKVGDLVKFKIFNRNAKFFRRGYENLIIQKALSGSSYSVFEKDKSNTWLVSEHELEFQNKKSINWKKVIENDRV